MNEFDPLRPRTKEAATATPLIRILRVVPYVGCFPFHTGFDLLFFRFCIVAACKFSCWSAGVEDLKAPSPFRLHISFSG